MARPEERSAGLPDLDRPIVEPMTKQRSSGSIDLLVRGGTLVDGTGAAPVKGDLAITSGTISAIGGRIDAPGAEVIDATGMTVTPGMINAGTVIGLSEIGSIAATNDMSEIEEINSHIKASVAIAPTTQTAPLGRSAT